MQYQTVTHGNVVLELMGTMAAHGNQIPKTMFLIKIRPDIKLKCKLYTCIYMCSLVGLYRFYRPGA